jgi:hypothetical protein
MAAALGPELGKSQSGLTGVTNLPPEVSTKTESDDPEVSGDFKPFEGENSNCGDSGSSSEEE